MNNGKNGNLTLSTLITLAALALAVISLVVSILLSTSSSKDAADRETLSRIESRIDGIERRLEAQGKVISDIQAQYGQIPAIREEINALRTLIVSLLRAQ